jgi:hypothetical protein
MQEIVYPCEVARRIQLEATSMDETGPLTGREQPYIRIPNSVWFLVLPGGSRFHKLAGPTRSRRSRDRNIDVISYETPS